MRAVISVSRRTDLPRWYPEWLASVLRAGEVEVPLPYGRDFRHVSLAPDDVHSVVLGSKNFAPLLENQGGLADALRQYEQCYLSLTITGLGGTPIEARVPPWELAARQLQGLVAFAGDARRVAVRFDPIVHWMEDREIRSNLPFAESVFRAAAMQGIPRVIVSFMTLYEKVKRRKWPWYDPPRDRKLEIAEYLKGLAEQYGVSLRGCCDPFLAKAGVPQSHCVDAALLTDLHPRGLAADATGDKGQRSGCGCSVSVDIGSYRQKCSHGCLYCYANPTWTKQ